MLTEREKEIAKFFFYAGRSDECKAFRFAKDHWNESDTEQELDSAIITTDQCDMDSPLVFRGIHGSIGK